MALTTRLARRKMLGFMLSRTTFLCAISLYRPRISSSCLPRMAQHRQAKARANSSHTRKLSKACKQQPRRSVNPCSAIKWGRTPAHLLGASLALVILRAPAVARASCVYSAIHHGCRQLRPRLHRQGPPAINPLSSLGKLTNARQVTVLSYRVNRDSQVHHRIACRMQAAKMCTWAPTRARFSSSSTLHRSGILHNNHIVPSVSIYNIWATEMTRTPFQLYVP